METPEFIKKIDWTELRTQKNLLLGTINNNAVSPIHKEGLEGILHLIDAVQDYAVDEIGMSSNDVYDFEEEDKREGYTGDLFIEPMSETETKETYICPICNSDNVQSKYWVGLNDMRVDDCVEGEHDFCLDCENHITAQSLPLLITAYVIGFQIVGVEGTDLEGEIHPDMTGSFCIYNLSWCLERIQKDNDWELLTIWLGDVEEPTMMFDGNMRQ